MGSDSLAGQTHRPAAAPSSTKNKDGERDPAMHQTKKGNQWCFAMKAHIGADADAGLAHTVVGTAANFNGVKQAHALVHGEERGVFSDAGYQGVGKREDTQDIKTTWHGQLSRPWEKHSAIAHALCTVEFVEGAKSIFAGGYGVTPSAVGKLSNKCPISG